MTQHLFRKMAVDSEVESEVFEITDFTTALEWERFISKVEDVLNDWTLIGHYLGKPPEKASSFHLHLELILCHSAPYQNTFGRELISQEC